MLTADPVTGRSANRTQGHVYSCAPIPAHLLEMVSDGGLIPHLAKKLKTQKGVP